MRRSHCNRLTPQTSYLPPRPTIPDFIATALVKPRATLSGRAATHQMAEDFRSLGGQTRDDLIRLGWTAAQVDALSAAAIVKAQALAGPSL